MRKGPARVVKATHMHNKPACLQGVTGAVAAGQRRDPVAETDDRPAFVTGQHRVQAFTFGTDITEQSGIRAERRNRVQVQSSARDADTAAQSNQRAAQGQTVVVAGRHGLHLYGIFAPEKMCKTLQLVFGDIAETGSLSGCHARQRATEGLKPVGEFSEKGFVDPAITQQNIDDAP